MKITCVLEKLRSAVSKTEKITTKKASLPVLECLLLEVVNNSLVIRSTNLDIGIEITVPVKVKTPGRVAVPAGVLSQFLSNLPTDGSVELEHNEKTLVISGDTFRTEIKTQDDTEFPSIPSVESGNETEISTKQIVTGFRSVWYAASPSSMKPELSSVYMYSDDDGALYFVATDSFRLAEKIIPDAKIDDISILIPHRNVAEIIRALADVDTSATITVGENQVTIITDDIYISSRLIDGNFPDYQKIIPNSSQVTVTVSTQNFADTLRVSDIFSDKFNQLTVTADPQKNKLSLTTSNADVGENTTDIPVDINGEEITINFNHRYITDSFQSINTDKLSLSLSANAPMVLRPAGDNTFQYLVMPMSN